MPGKDGMPELRRASQLGLRYLGRNESQGTQAILQTKKAVALDPGRTIGGALWDGLSYYAGQIAIDNVWLTLDDIDTLVGLEWIIYEGFDYRDWQPNASLVGVEVIGVVKEWRRQRAPDTKLKEQRAHEMDWFTDERIKKAGLWLPGNPHAMDALRHLMNFRKDFIV
jgi:hypothetical protein